MAVVINGTSGITTNSGTLLSNSTIGVGGTTPAASGAGITFPATQSASSDANTLDDYEEGTWTPELRFGGATTGITYTNRGGYYVKAGQFVYATALVDLSNKGSATGQAQLAGLPFSSLNDGNYRSSGSMGNGGNFSSLIAGGTVYLGPNGTVMDFVYFTTTGTADLSNTNFNNNTTFRITMVYRSNS